MLGNIYYKFRRDVVDEMKETEEPYAFWYEKRNDEYAVYQNNKDGEAEFLFVSPLESEVTGFLYLCALLAEKEQRFSECTLIEMLGVQNIGE